MAETLYAWSRIVTGNDDNNRPVYLEWGDTVTAADVGGEDALQDMVDARAVRNYSPSMVPDGKDWVETDGLQQNKSYVRHLIDAGAERARAQETTGGALSAPAQEEQLLGLHGAATVNVEQRQMELDAQQAELEAQQAELDTLRAEAEKTAKANEPAEPKK